MKKISRYAKYCIKVLKCTYLIRLHNHYYEVKTRRCVGSCLTAYTYIGDYCKNYKWSWKQQVKPSETTSLLEMISYRFLSVRGSRKLLRSARAHTPQSCYDCHDERYVNKRYGELGLFGLLWLLRHRNPPQHRCRSAAEEGCIQPGSAQSYRWLQAPCRPTGKLPYVSDLQP